MSPATIKRLFARGPEDGVSHAPSHKSNTEPKSTRTGYPPKSWIPNTLAAIRIAVRPMKTTRLAQPNQASNGFG